MLDLQIAPRVSNLYYNTITTVDRHIVREIIVINDIIGILRSFYATYIMILLHNNASKHPFKEQWTLTLTLLGFFKLKLHFNIKQFAQGIVIP